MCATGAGAGGRFGMHRGWLTSGAPAGGNCVSKRSCKPLACSCREESAIYADSGRVRRRKAFRTDLLIGSPAMTEERRKFDEALDATRRTRLANERTYLAWWRT